MYTGLIIFFIEVRYQSKHKQMFGIEQVHFWVLERLVYLFTFLISVNMSKQSNSFKEMFH